MELGDTLNGTQYMQIYGCIFKITRFSISKEFEKLGGFFSISTFLTFKI